MLITSSKIILTPVLSTKFPELDGFGVMGYRSGIKKNVSFFVSGIKLLSFNYTNLYFLRLKWLDKSYEIREDHSNNPSDPRRREKQAVAVSLVNESVVLTVGEDPNNSIVKTRIFPSQLIEVNFTLHDKIEITPNQPKMRFECNISQKRHRIESTIILE